MNGIASLLDDTANAHVERIWQELESRCGLKGIRMTPFPHVTWQVTGGYDLAKLEQVLHDITKNIHPFIIHTDGIGIFTGEKPVVYLSIFKDEFLLRLHSNLWEQTKGFAKDPDRQYSPPHWIPHITIAYNDLHRANLDCVMQALVFQTFEWEITIDNLIFISQTGTQTTEMGKYLFDV